MPQLARNDSATFTVLVRNALPDGRFVVTNSSRRDIPKGTAFVNVYAERGTLGADWHVVVHDREQGPEVALKVDAIEFFRRSIECIPCGHHAGVAFEGAGAKELRTFLESHPSPWLVSLVSMPSESTTGPSICERIADARGGDLIVRIEDAVLPSPSEAARLFGLSDAADIYFEIPAHEAKKVLVAVLTKDMAYGSPLVPPDQAAELAEAFLKSFGTEGVRCFTNGEYGKPRSHPNIGPSWSPATEFTFDSGVLVLSPHHVGCAWFMDED